MPGSSHAADHVVKADGDATAELALCCRLMRGVAHLPLLPLKSWCNHAATLLSPLMPEAVVAVALVEKHPVRHLVHVPVAGLCVGSRRDARINGKDLERVQRRLTDDHWNTLTPDGQFGVRHVPASHVPARSLVFGIPEYQGGLIVGTAPCSPPGRQIVMHAVFDRLPDNSIPLGVLHAVINELGTAASAAFPAEASYSNLVTRQEELVVELLTQGLTVPEISTRVSRSRHTVHDHIKKLHAKTGISTRGELVARALGHLPAPHDPGAPEHRSAPAPKPDAPKTPAKPAKRRGT